MRYPLLALSTAVTAAALSTIVPVVVGAARSLEAFVRALGAVSTWSF